MSERKLNLLPAPTFRWLGVNHALTSLSDAPGEPAELSPEGVQRLEITEGGRYSISVPRDGDAFVIAYISGSGSTEFEINAAPGSRVKLAEIFDTGGQALSQVHSRVDEGAVFELVQIYVGGSTVSGIETQLSGRKARTTVDIAYLLEGKDELDINLSATHTGKKSESEINVRGVLDGEARKVFKGTIDFKNGAAGAKGSENEDVLIMSGKAVNKTVPLILCAEEDVDGSHGASIGQIDERQVYYMQSRGIPQDRIAELVAWSKIARVIRAVGDDETRQRLEKQLGRGEDDE